MPPQGMKYILAVRNDTAIKLDLLRTKDGWYHLRWLRIEEDGVSVYQKQIGLSVEEIKRIAKAVEVEEVSR